MCGDLNGYYLHVTLCLRMSFVIEIYIWKGLWPQCKCITSMYNVSIMSMMYCCNCIHDVWCDLCKMWAEQISIWTIKIRTDIKYWKRVVLFRADWCDATQRLKWTKWGTISNQNAILKSKWYMERYVGYLIGPVYYIMLKGEWNPDIFSI